jgi:hypothetical protein
MRFLRRVLLGVALTGLLSVSPLMAQVEFTPFAGGAIALGNLSDGFSFGDFVFDNQKLQPSLVVGLHGGVWVTSNISVEGTVMMSPTVITSPSPDLSFGGTESGLYNATTVLTYGVNVLLNFPPSEGFVEPFLTGGVGQRKISGEDTFGGFDGPTDLTFNVGAGIRWKIHPSYAIRFDVRDYISSFAPNEEYGDDTEVSQNDLVISIGISFSGN